MSILRLIACLCLVGWVSGCASSPRPTLSGMSSGDGSPGLVPLGPLLAAAEGATASAGPAEDLSGRIAALEARAQRLRGPVIPPATKTRMARGVALP